MELMIERCAFVDIHRDTAVTCVRTPDGVGGRRKETRTFGTTTGQVLALRDWLVEQRVTLVGMESTGIYWKPIYYLLEDDFECWLINATHMHNVPGKKTDVLDASVGGGADRARAGPPVVCAAQTDPGAAGSDPLPQDGDRGTRT